MSHDHTEHFKDNRHEGIDHVIEGTPRNMAKMVLARHLCGWITGHNAPLAHFELDAEMILDNFKDYGLIIGRWEE